MKTALFDSADKCSEFTVFFTKIQAFKVVGPFDLRAKKTRKQHRRNGHGDHAWKYFSR